MRWTMPVTPTLADQLTYDLTRLARVKEGRRPEPTASVIDTQSVKTAINVPLTSQGTDAAKKIVGRKRGIITDTLGLLLAVTVTAASLSENAVGIQLLDQAKKTYPSVSKSWVDTGFKNAVIEHGASLGIDVEVVNRNPGVRGFHVASIDNPTKRITDETTPSGIPLPSSWTTGTVRSNNRPARRYRVPGPRRRRKG